MKANKILVAMGVGSMLLCGTAFAAGNTGSGKVVNADRKLIHSG